MATVNDNIKPTSIRLNADIYEKVKDDADREKRSISKQIEFIIEKYYKIKAETNN